MPGVLIVDDERLVCFSFSRALRKEGIIVENAENGRAAIEKIDNEKFDLVVVDLCLGDMDGTDVIRHLKKKSPETKIIVITAYEANRLKEEMMLDDIDGFYEKPFDTYEIVDTIVRSLQRQFN